MKKILFLQIKGNSLGGVWFVNKTLGEEFIKRGYHVEVLAIRNNHPGLDITDTPLKITTINEQDKWGIVHRRDIFYSLKKGNFIKILKNYFKDDKKLKEDYRKMQEFINEYNPDYIISSHYQTLFGVPGKYLSKVIFVQHSSFDYLLKDRFCVKTLRKLNDKLFKLCWLSKSSMNKALEFGFKKNTYIYNPNKFMSSEVADVSKNKKIVVVTRINAKKRIYLMIEMVNEVLKEFPEWTFEIYGTGTFNEKSQKILDSSKQIFYKGLTNNSKEVLLKGSLSLNTSIYEGFSLSIIESFSTGLPVIAFDFGEAAHEQIIDDYNGYIIEKDNTEMFKKKLKELLQDKIKLEQMSRNAKEFSKQFEVSKVAFEWEKLFKEIK